MMHPVGPHSAQTYWVRRALVAVVAVAVVIGGVWWALGRSSGPAPDNTASVGGPTSTKLTGVLASSAVDGMDSLTSDPLVADTTDSTSDASAAAGTTAASGTAASGAATTTAAATSGAVKTTAGTTTKPVTTATTTGKLATTGAATTTAPARVTVTVTKPAAPTTAPKTTAPTTTAPPKPSYDSAGRLICPASSIQLTPMVWGAIAGQNSNVAMTVKNISKETCRQDTSGAAQVYTVLTAAGAHVWSTADCFPGEGSEVITLGPGQEKSYVVTWSGKVSAPGKCAASQRPAATAGKYQLVVRLGAMTSKPLAFTLK